MISEAELNDLLLRPSDTLDALDRLDCEESLLAFTRRMWPVLEPGRRMVEGWPLEAICEFLEAISRGEIQKGLINVPPGFMKSLLTEVFWPAWEWGPLNRPSLRYVSFSYSSSLTQRDNRRFKDLLLSRDYGRLWGDNFDLKKVGEELVSNDKTGWKLATSIGGVGTGERGDRVILDDPHNVKESESDNVRQETVRWFRESMASRLNDAAKSAVVIIMQRVHEEDVSGVVLSDLRHEYEHLMIPMEWEGQKLISTAPNFMLDPRTHAGELAWPGRFPVKEVRNLKVTSGPFAWAGQYQQSPTPRGGGIFRRDYWMLWGNPDEPDDPRFLRFPVCDFTLASLDTAYDEKTENDYSALTIWGAFKEAVPTIRSGAGTMTARMQQSVGRRKIILMDAWQKRLPLQGVPQDTAPQHGETRLEWFRRVSPMWGLVEWTMWSCKRLGVNKLIIESKASGISVAQTIRTLQADAAYGILLIDPGRLDKVARAYSVQHLFADSMIYAPDRPWAEAVISQMSVFPKTAHDDLTDSASQALKHLRDIGLALHGHEIDRELAEAMAYKPAQQKPLYPI